ncbi:MAG TPA: DUF3127 domain-containing protein [Cytophagaceae bacterium]|jgi:hypothetical protein|nr:DUF3127 domain-containing protein [Cytophagaceae bacterium]
MALDITGKIVKILPEQTGAGKKGTWIKQEFVIETAEQYPKKICCSAWGDKVDALKSFSMGDTIKVSFNLESREYNERWYTDVRAWKIESAEGGSSNAAPRTSPAAKKQDEGDPFANIQGEEDLPF